MQNSRHYFRTAASGSISTAILGGLVCIFKFEKTNSHLTQPPEIPYVKEHEWDLSFILRMPQVNIDHPRNVGGKRGRLECTSDSNFCESLITFYSIFVCSGSL